jgi:hypothetical protein
VTTKREALNKHYRGILAFVSADNLKVETAVRIERDAPPGAYIAPLLEVRRRTTRWGGEPNLRHRAHVDAIIGDDKVEGHGQWFANWCTLLADALKAVMELTEVAKGSYFYRSCKIRRRFFEALADKVAEDCAGRVEYRDCARVFVKHVLGVLHSVYARCRQGEPGLAFVWTTHYMRRCLRSHDGRGPFSAKWLRRVSDDARAGAAACRARRLGDAKKEWNEAVDGVTCRPSEWTVSHQLRIDALLESGLARQKDFQKVAMDAADALVALGELRKLFGCPNSSTPKVKEFEDKMGSKALRDAVARAGDGAGRAFDSARAVKACTVYSQEPAGDYHTRAAKLYKLAVAPWEAFDVDG